MIKQKKRIIEPIVHILTWCTLFVFAVLISGKNETNIIPAHAWLPLIEGIVIFYLNYLYLIERFIFSKRNFTLFLSINILVILVFRFDMYLYHLLSGNTKVDIKTEHEGLHQEEPLSLLRSVLGLTVPAVFAFAIKIKDRWQRMELERKEIKNSQLQSELKNLKYQLQPHFFFNSLNNIYSLINISPAGAQKAIHDLSRLMQYLLHDANAEKLDLYTELSYLRKYIEIMKIRQPDDVTTICEMPDIQECQYCIAPLLLIPIVENAYKHGVSATAKSTIDFQILIVDNKLYFSSSNPNQPKDRSDKSGSGIGLDNLQKRLALIYPNKHTLNAEIRDNVFYLNLSVELDLFNESNIV